MENAKPDTNKTAQVDEVQKQTKPDNRELSNSKPSSPNPSVKEGESTNEQDKPIKQLASSSGDKLVDSPEDKNIENMKPNSEIDENSKTKDEPAVAKQTVDETVVNSLVDNKSSPLQIPNELMPAQPKEEVMKMLDIPAQPKDDSMKIPDQKQKQIAFMDQGDTSWRRRRLDEMEPPHDYFETTIYKMGRRSKPGNVMLEVPGGITPVASSEVQTEDVVFEEIEEDENMKAPDLPANELTEEIPEEKTSKTKSLGKIIKESWQKKFPKKESEVDIPSEFDQQDNTDDYNVYTGMFADGIRRVDYVLVLHASENLMAERTKLAFLMGLVSAGIQLESEVGVLKEHQDIQFVKLYAPDVVLDKYAGLFGVRRYFRNNHENFMNNKISFMEEHFKLKQETDWLKSVRSHYMRPLQLSNHERSYIVYLLLRFQNPKSGHGLDRLLQKRIILDAFALHDGPYYCTPHQKFDTFNCRQVLFLNWPGRHNMLKYQPLHMIHEYFGSKVAFYFVFYGFYNMALLFATCWAFVMSIAYALKDCEYFDYIRNYICHIRDVKVSNSTVVTEVLKIVPNSAVCGECEGATDPTVCPITVVQDSCFDLKLMQYFDNPYIIIYSLGMAFWSLLFLAYWRRTECYWKWIWEEHRPRRQVMRFSAIDPRELRAGCDPCGRRLPARLRRGALNVVLALFSLGVLCLLMFIVILYAHVEWAAPRAAKKVKVVRKRPGSYNDIIPPKINRPKEYGLLILLTLFTLFTLNSIEKMLHAVSTFMTRLEGHRTFLKHEQSLILKYFTISFVYGSCLIMYFAFIKGAFHSTPIAIWTVDINLTLPWKNYSVSLALVSDYWRNVTMRALTMNCGPFSCLRQASVVCAVTILFRTAAQGISTLMSTRAPRPRTPVEALPTCEREYMLHHVSHHELTHNFNALVTQFAIMLLFAPLFPWAPLCALLVNVWDLRNKAKVYLTQCRRVVLFRSGGIGYWDHIIKVICYATPLFHALIIARTEIFKRYVFYKLHGPNITRGLERKFRRYMTEVNIEIYRISKTHGEFGEVNRYRVSTDMASFNPTLFISTSNRWVGVYQCRVDGFFENTKYKSGDGWSVQWNYFGENFSMAAPQPDHYYVKYLKVVFVIAYVHVLGAVGACVWRLVGAGGGPLARYRQRQRLLARLHHHRLNFIRRTYRS